MSKWKVTCNHIDGKKYYRAYRLINEKEVDHSGNREYAGDYTQSREEAQKVADLMNAREEEK